MISNKMIINAVMPLMLIPQNDSQVSSVKIMLHSLMIKGKYLKEQKRMEHGI